MWLTHEIGSTMGSKDVLHGVEVQRAVLEVAMGQGQGRNAVVQLGCVAELPMMSVFQLWIIPIWRSNLGVDMISNDAYCMTYV